MQSFQFFYELRLNGYGNFSWRVNNMDSICFNFQVVRAMKLTCTIEDIRKLCNKRFFGKWLVL